MTIRMYPFAPYFNTTFITAIDSGQAGRGSANGQGYASLLHELMYGVPPDHYDDHPVSKPFHFAARCEFQAIKYRDNWRSSWRKVDFHLSNGVSRANVTEERCTNPKGWLDHITRYESQHLADYRQAIGRQDLMTSTSTSKAPATSCPAQTAIANCSTRTPTQHQTERTSSKACRDSMRSSIK
jgi:hypothetical protein